MAQDNQDYEMNLLQELLVQPEVSDLRSKVVDLEENLAQLGEKLQELSQKDDSDKIAKTLEPLITKIIREQLAEFKQEILAAISSIATEKSPIEADKSLSIRVIGINQGQKAKNPPKNP